MKNNVKTYILLATMGGLIILIGGLVGRGSGATIGLLAALGFTGASYWFSDRIAIKASRAVPVTEAQMPEYYAVVRDLTRRAGLPMPKLYVSPSQQPNAFATGRNPSHAAVAVTQGILGTLSWEELRGVLAHEISHVGNRDILIGSVAAAAAMGIMWIARIGFFFGGGGRRNNVLVTLAMLILAPVAAMLLQMAPTPSPEVQGDRSGARLLGRGNLPASAPWRAGWPQRLWPWRCSRSRACLRAAGGGGAPPAGQRPPRPGRRRWRARHREAPAHGDRRPPGPPPPSTSGRCCERSSR